MKKLYNTYDEYTPEMDFDGNSDEEVLLMLKKQLEITERKGLQLIISAGSWVNETKQATTSPIYADKITPYHTHEFYEANFVLEGKLADIVDGNAIILNKGDMLIMNPSVHHIAFPIGKTLAKNFIIHPSLLEQTASLISDENPENNISKLIKRGSYEIFTGLDKLGINEKISKLDLINKRRVNTVFCVANINNLAEDILINLAECECHYYSVANLHYGHENSSRDKEILNYISKNFKTTSLEKVAKHFGYSAQQIRRIVKKNFGASYVDYVKKCRMGKIQKLLASTNLPIREISELAGYESPEYFSRRFKFETGYPPTEYRRISKSKEKTKWEIDNEVQEVEK